MVIEGTKIFSCDELTNEQYHAETEHVSGSSLCEIMNTCLAKWRYRDRDEEEQKAHLSFGTSAHTMMLEQERFNAEYFRYPEVSDYSAEDNLLHTKTAMQAWLKERGIKGSSSADPAKLASGIRETCANAGLKPPMFFFEIIEEADKLAKGKEIVRGNDFDTVIRMREVITKNPQFSRLLNEGDSEVSVFTTLRGVKVKVRYDKLFHNGTWDYKTTTDASPQWFSRHAFQLGYFLKMALQYEVFKKAFGRYPDSVNLLAQEKKTPFIVENYVMSEEALHIGRCQLRAVLDSYKMAKETGIYPSYGNGSAMLLVPEPYIMNKFPDMNEPEVK